MIDVLKKNAIQFFRKRFLYSSVFSYTVKYRDLEAGYTIDFVFLIIYDMRSANTHKVIVVDNLDTNKTGVIIKHINEIQKNFNDQNKKITIISPPLTSYHSSIDSSHMPLNHKLYFYTNQLHNDKLSILNQLQNLPIPYEIVDQSSFYNSIFISYGGADETIAKSINNELKSKGVKTWFFPDDNIPGVKLHKTMYDGINEYDKILLLCSQDSLNRPGVLNEVEEVFTREAKSGGQAILIPIALDDYIFSETNDRIKRLRESRIIRTIDVNNKEVFEKEIDKILDALKVT